MGALRLEPVGLIEREATADVVFVHGLGGDPTATWQVDRDASTFWPVWIFEDVQGIKVWSLGYPADAIHWGSPAGELALPDRAKSIIDLLISNDVGTRPLAFVAHSLGGLVVKQILRIASDMNQPTWEQLAANTCGVVFLATPHQGAVLASIAKALPIIAPTVNVTQLSANDSHLRDLNDWYQQNVSSKRIRTHVYYETQPTGPALVVTQASATLGVQGCVPIPFDGNHVSICKPRTRLSPVYLGTLHFIKTILGSGEIGGLEPTAASPDDAGSQDPYLALSDEYEVYTNKVDEDEKLDLEEKLRRGNRESEIPRAIRLKELFAKQFTRNSLQASATRKYINILAEVESRFNAHVYPEILGGASKAKIADLVREKVTNPILSSRPNDESINAVVIDRMIYYLTGLCHIRWSA